MSLLRWAGVALDRGGRRLFEGLDLDLQAGGALHLAGPNGSGKSSLLRLAAGLLRPSAGTIAPSTAALADDHLALDRELPLAQALEFWEPGATPSALDAFGLGTLAEIPVRLLSAGQLRRASLARVAAAGAPLWLLDEPLNGLDADGAARLDAAIAAHRAGGGGVIAASHAPLAGTWARQELGR